MPASGSTPAPRFKRQVRVSDFAPSRHGFRFRNHFPGLPLPAELSRFIDPARSTYGLCGGMIFAVLDHYRIRKPLPKTKDIPANGTPLYEYIARRQWASFGAMGGQALRFVQFMGWTDERAQAESYQAWGSLQARLDQRDLTPLGLVYFDFSESLRVWDNHQVLAYGYQITLRDTIRILIYDPNGPGRDDLTIRARQVRTKRGEVVERLACTQFRGERKYRNLHGFMVVPYEPGDPPGDLG